MFAAKPTTIVVAQAFKWIFIDFLTHAHTHARALLYKHIVYIVRQQFTHTDAQEK